MTEPGGLSSAVIVHIEAILLNLFEIKNSYSVFVFGSRVKGNFKQYSDLDLWIETEPKLESHEISYLKDQFEESSIPIKVDIVTPETCLPEYLEQIQSQKKLWFHKNTNK